MSYYAMTQKLSAAKRDRELADLANQVSVCSQCAALVAGRTHPVFGSGNHSAAILLVGEAPGRNEDLKGEPFVGAAGRVLNGILEALGVLREDVFITNVVKCRPPKNRKPLPDEIANCRPYLETQIALIQPRVLGALGGTAAGALLDTRETLARLRGTVHRYRNIPVVCTYHPAYVFRNREIESLIQDDLRLLVGQIGS
jgi:DNA polymerase